MDSWSSVPAFPDWGYADWTRPSYPKTAEQQNSLTDALKQCPLFQGIAEEVPWMGNCLVAAV